MGEHLQYMTAKEIAERLGVGTDAVRMKYKRMFPGRPFDVNENLPGEIYVRLLSDGRKKDGEQKPAKKRAEVARQLLADTPVEVREKVVRQYSQKTGQNWQRRAALTALLLAPTAASVTNMLHVTGEITGEPITAALYTIVLSITALGFTLSGIRSWVTVALAIVLIGYESFCNLTRLYYGLMGGVTGNPTRFLGTVTDIFQTGSHGTAIAIAAFSAAMLAAVQYTAILELQKRPDNA